MTVIGPSPELRASLKDRATEALRMRKRYLRRSTFIAGQGTPLTKITSPKRLPSSSPSKMSWPSLEKSASFMTSGTS